MPPSPSRSFGWTDVDDIADALVAAHPSVDPLTLRFTALRAMVEQLPGFTADPAHPVNERILEEIQAIWHQEREGAPPEDD